MRTLHHPGAIILVALATATAACGDDPDPNAAIDKLAGAVCETAARCCAAGELGFLLGPYTDPSTCPDRFSRALEAGAGGPFALAPVDDGALTLTDLEAAALAAEAGHVAVDSAALDDCIAFLSAQTCPTYTEPEEAVGPCENAGADPEPPAGDPDQALCDLDRIFDGTLGKGEVCTTPGSAIECKEGLVCRRLVSCTGADCPAVGLCIAPGQAGDFCVVDAGCAGGLYCSQLDGTCREPSAEGQACAYADPDNPNPGTQIIRCEPGLSCDPVAELCVASCERGASCFDDDQCAADLGLRCIANRCSSDRQLGQTCVAATDCTDGLTCGRDPRDPGHQVCIERLAVGEPCPPGGHDQCQTDFCDPATGTCANPAAAGQLCESGLSNQCTDSYCETTTAFCTLDTDCPGSGKCNIDQGRCEYYCVGLLPEGTTCTRAEQCQSQACVDGLCRTLPLADGQLCTSGDQCESSFCATDTGVCDELPLADGRACFYDQMCSSGICFESLCVAGVAEGEICGGTGALPCAVGLYCDGELLPPRCAPVKAAGSACESDDQCRGQCVDRFSRALCDLTPAPETVACDGI